MANYPKKMKKGCSCSCSPLQTHKDVVTEIALHLPLKFLFRCRGVCKLWRDVIDSPFFRKLHSRNNYSNKEEDDDETVYLQLNYLDFVGCDVKVPIKLLHTHKEKEKLYFNLVEGFSAKKKKKLMGEDYRSMFIRRVKGLICFNLATEPSVQRLAICNPFLGQTKILPISPIYTSSSKCDIVFKDVAIGCDGEFYKVVELAICVEEHRCVHALLYSSRTGSWRGLGNIGLISFEQLVTMSCNDGHFAHWCSRFYILTFDMKNEEFRLTQMPELNSLLVSGDREPVVVAKDDGYSFIMMITSWRGELVRIYESSISICEEENGINTRILSWNHVVNLELPLVQPTRATSLPLWRRDCVIVKLYDSNWEIKLLFYDYRAMRFIGYFHLPAKADLLDFKGSFILP